MIERAQLTLDWLRNVEAEIEHREREALTAAGGNARQQFMAQLAEIGARLRAAPDWREPTPSEKRRNARVIEMWFRRKGYGRG